MSTNKTPRAQIIANYKAEESTTAKTRELLREKLLDNKVVKQINAIIAKDDFYNDGWVSGDFSGEILHSTRISIDTVLDSLNLPADVINHYRDTIIEVLMEDDDVIKSYGIRVPEDETNIHVTSHNYIIGISYRHGRTAYLSHWDKYIDLWDIDENKRISDEGALHYLVTKFFYEENPEEYIGVYVQDNNYGHCRYNEALTRLAGDIMEKKKVFKITTEEEFVNIVRLLCDLRDGDTYDDTRVTRALHSLYSPITTSDWDVNIDDLSKEINDNVVYATSIADLISYNGDDLDELGLLEEVEAIQQREDRNLAIVYKFLQGKGLRVAYNGSYYEHGSSEEDGILLWMTKESKLGNKKEGDK